VKGFCPGASQDSRAALQGYQSNRQDFPALLTSFLDVLHLDEEYWRSMAERETALAQIEQLTDCHCAGEGRRDENLSHRVLAGIDWNAAPARGILVACGFILDSETDGGCETKPSNSLAQIRRRFHASCIDRKCRWSRYKSRRSGCRASG